MGTSLQIKVFDNVSPILQEKIKLEILNFTTYFDDTFSRFKTDNIISKISEKAGRHTVPKELTELLAIYKEFNTVTNGSMNPLIGNTLSDLGYDANYSLRPKEVIRKTPVFSETLHILSETEIEVREEVLIDVGAIGKGYWVDRVCEILEQNKVSRYMVNGSGDIFYKSPIPKPLMVTLESINQYTDIQNEAICGSGTDKRNWSVNPGENLHHVVNANTGLPTENILSVWVKVKNAKLPTTIADGLATAIFFTDPKVLKEKYDFEYLILDSNKKTLFSENFNAHL